MQRLGRLPDATILPLLTHDLEDDTDQMDIVDCWGNVVDTIPINPKRVRPYIDADPVE